MEYNGLVYLSLLHIKCQSSATERVKAIIAAVERLGLQVEPVGPARPVRPVGSERLHPFEEASCIQYRPLDFSSSLDHMA